MGLFDKKYDWNKNKYDTLFYGTDMKNAEVCYVNRHIKCGGKKFHWVVISPISKCNDDKAYLDHWALAWPVINAILLRENLDADAVKPTPTPNAFWRVLDENSVSISLVGDIAKLSDRPIIKRDGLISAFLTNRPHCVSINKATGKACTWNDWQNTSPTSGLKIRRK